MNLTDCTISRISNISVTMNYSRNWLTILLQIIIHRKLNEIQVLIKQVGYRGAISAFFDGFVRHSGFSQLAEESLIYYSHLRSCLPGVNTVSGRNFIIHGENVCREVVDSAKNSRPPRNFGGRVFMSQIKIKLKSTHRRIFAS